MLFKRKNKKNYDIMQNQTTNVETGSSNKEPDIALIEQALQKPHSNDDRICLLKVAGDAYAQGLFKAEKDEKKAASYYKEAADLGSLECQCEYGRMLITNEDGDDMLFSVGVMKVCDCYKKGYTPAKEVLQTLLELDVFPNCKTVDDILAIAGM